ncbi:MAG: sigma-70 family RNA polymerase sigma factor [Kiloniellales bacterium]|nr:sigma-70 family RNA polymerase sigma factor [Kiloniellales bacterium]
MHRGDAPMQIVDHRRGAAGAEVDLERLLGRCALRDRTAFVALYEAAAPRLYGVALRMLKREAWAEEALQEAFMKIWLGAASYRAERGRPLAWMTGIMRNEAISLLRKSAYKGREVEWTESGDLRVSADDPALSAELRDDIRRVSHCLDRLSTDQRLCVLKAYHEGYTPTELSKSLGRPVDTVKTWLRRGVSRLRECLGHAA